MSTTSSPPVTFIDEAAIAATLGAAERADAARVREILARAREAHGLDMADVAVLTSVSDPELLGELFAAARHVKDTIYGSRLVLFAPLYISNLCQQRLPLLRLPRAQQGAQRRALSQDEIRAEIENLVDQGHKRVLLVAGESYPHEGFGYILKSIATIYSASSGGQRRDPARQRQHRAAHRRRVPRAQGDRHRHVPALPGDLPPRDVSRGAPGRQEARLRLARDRHGPRHGGRHRRRRHRRAVRPLRLALRGAGPAAAHPPPRAALRRGPAHHQRAAPRAGRRLGHRRPPAAAGLRRRLPQARRHPAPGGALHRHHHVDARDRRTCAARPSPWACRRSRPAAAPTPAATPTRSTSSTRPSSSSATTAPSTRSSATWPSMGYIPSFCTACYRLGRTGQDFMDLAKPGEIKHALRPQRAVDLHGVPARLRLARHARGRRDADRGDARADGRARARHVENDCSRGCAAASATCYC